MRRSAAVLGMTIALFGLLAEGFSPTTPLAASAKIQVQATIQPYLRFMAEQQRHSFEVGEQDLLRGYVDLAQSLRVVVRTNTPDRVSVAVACGSYPVVVLGPRGSAHEVVFEPAELLANQQVSKSVDIRVLLSPEMDQGTYPLLLDLSPQVY